uniref:G-protein coupled receptors family 1 profile domain-containing protein n=1 Tax=Pelusios castaneus TaxID=367368 RepID=A0A8C8VJX6_9SAUR
MADTEQGNQTSISEFILLGFGNLPELQILLFLLFLVIYIVTMAGNVLIVVLVVANHQLQTPMYFFLGNLSCLETCYSSTILPRMLTSLLTGDRTISLRICIVCAAQMYFSLLLSGTECFLLAVMAYDCYVAICNPLRYTVTVTRVVCVRMVAGSWLVNNLVHFGWTYLVFSLPFCGSHVINHFFCDIPPLMELSCVDTYRNRRAVFMALLLFVITPFFLIVISYIKITGAILKMPSVQGRHKAFSTCSSHLTVVTLFYGSAMIAYLKPKTEDSMDSDKLFSLFYTIVTPLFHPLIYSLRNK